MAEFNKNRVCHKGKIFPVCVGDIGYYSNSLEEMQEFVEKETGIQGVLTDILVGDYPFEINHSDGAGFKFFYLISYKEEGNDNLCK